MKLTPGMALEIEMEALEGRKVRLSLYAKQGGARLRLSSRVFETQEKAWLKVIRLGDKQLVELGLEAEGVADQVQGS